MKIAIVCLLLSACVDPPPNTPTCEEAQQETFVLDPVEVCLVYGWQDGDKLHVAGFSQADPDKPGAWVVGPSTYNRVLKQPGILVDRTDGNCEWMPCRGGVDPIDAGTR